MTSKANGKVTTGELLNQGEGTMASSSSERDDGWTRGYGFGERRYCVQLRQIGDRWSWGDDGSAAWLRWSQGDSGSWREGGNFGESGLVSEQ